MSTPPPVLTELRLTDEMKQAIDDAFGDRRPMIISYVDELNAPQLSYRGSTQVFSETALAIWVRDPEGRILESIEKNPAVAMLYGYFLPDDCAQTRVRFRIPGCARLRNRPGAPGHEKS